MKKLILLIIGMLMFSMQALADPPGLSGKGGGEFPRGLESHEKTPHGWNQGKKVGWDKNHVYHHHHHHYHYHHYNRDFDRD